jgi:hypothetical protein
MFFLALLMRAVARQAVNPIHLGAEDMDTTWRRTLAVSITVITFLFLAHLEIARSRTLHDQPITVVNTEDQERTEGWRAFLLTQGELLGLEAGPSDLWRATDSPEQAARR